MNKMANYDKAAEFYNKIYIEFSNDILADNALYNYAQLLEKKLDRKVEAMEFYKLLLTNYPGSIFVSEARKNYRNLRNIFNPDEVGKPN